MPTQDAQSAFKNIESSLLTTELNIVIQSNLLGKYTTDYPQCEKRERVAILMLGINRQKPLPVIKARRAKAP